MYHAKITGWLSTKKRVISLQREIFESLWWRASNFRYYYFIQLEQQDVFIICSFLSNVRGTKNHLYPLKLLIFRSFWIKWCLCNNRSQWPDGGGRYQLDIYIVIVCGRKGRGTFFLKSVIFRRYDLFVCRGGSGVAQGWLAIPWCLTLYRICGFLC